MTLEPVGIDVDGVLLRLAAEPHHVDYPGDLPELALEDEVLGRLQLGEGVARSLERVAENLADRVPGRELRLDAGRKLDELEPVQDPLLRGVIVRIPVEVTLHVGEPEQRLRADVIEVYHAPQPVFPRDG